MDKKKQLIQLLVILMSCSFLFILAGCSSNCMDEFAVSDCSDDLTVHGLSIPGICYDSHKFMAGCIDLSKLDDEEDEGETYIVSCDSTDEDGGCFGCGDCYVFGSCSGIDQWGYKWKIGDGKEKWTGCMDGCIGTKDSDGLVIVLLKIMEAMLGIN